MINHPFAREFLPEYLKSSFVSFERIVEVGVYEGNYAEVIMKTFPNSELYLVDKWQTEGNDFYYSLKSADDYCNVENAHIRAQEKFKHFSNVHLVKDSSLATASKFEDNYFDWVYIDADHSYEGVLSDLKTWISKLKVGGVMSGHDWDPDVSMPEYRQFGANKAISEFLNEDLSELNLTSETYHKTWYFYKK